MPLEQKDLAKNLSSDKENWAEYAANLPEDEVKIVDNLKYKGRRWYSKWWGILLLLLFFLLLLMALYFAKWYSVYNQEIQNGTLHYYMLHQNDNWESKADLLAITRSDDDPRWGKEDAKVVVVEFSDFTCPYCQQFNNEMMPKLMEDYSDKILFIYRDNPIMSTAAGESVQVANLVNCIYKNLEKKEDYWKVHNYVFLMGENTVNIHKDFDGYYDVAKVQACVDNQDMYNEILDDYYVASELGLEATPLFYINGNLFYGSQDYAEWQYVLDQYLNHENAN